MSTHEMCRLWLCAVRATAPAKARERFKGAAVLGDVHDGFTVELADSTQLHVGRVCCRYAARSEALSKLAAEVSP